MIKLAVSYALIGDARFGALGAPIGSLCCAIAATALNIYFMRREARECFSVKNVFFKPLAASAVSVAVAIVTYLGVIRFGKVYFSLMISVSVAAVGYFCVSLLIGSINAEDLASVPIINRFSNRMNKKRKRDKNDCSGKEKTVARKGKL